VAQVDAMSGGRVELGLGAGWFRDEHAAYGIPFPGTGERFDRLEEQLAVITGLWATPEGERFAAPGPHYPIEASPGLPKPVQRPRPPLIIGGKGPRRTPRLAATYADEFNVPFPQSVDEFAAARARVAEACDAAGRDPGTLIWSVALVTCCGADEGEYERRAETIGRAPADLRGRQAAGTPDEVLDVLARYAEAGAERVYLQLLDHRDLDHVALLGAEVRPAAADLGTTPA
jgi:alkanesulfonate monooxygenase SsuD/methylene tetrahydromethanopterin reductase-like flavin-dependent oxidoreductase (luciferase family)